MPQSFAVLLQLPAEKLRHVMESTPAIKGPLQQHVSSLSERQKLHLPAQILKLVETGKVEVEKSIPVTAAAEKFPANVDAEKSEDADQSEKNAQLDGDCVVLADSVDELENGSLKKSTCLFRFQE